MTKYKSLVTPNLNFAVLAGNCLAMAQGIVGAPIMHPSATVAANNTQFRHANREIPNAVCVLWFDHWGTYGAPGQEVYANWGHVVVYVPGKGFASSSPVFGEVSTPYYYDSIGAVERAFAATFRFWTEDINGLRVCEPVSERDVNKPVEYITLDTNKRKAKQVYSGGKAAMVQFTEGHSAITTKDGDYQLAAEFSVTGTPNDVVKLTVYRYIWDGKKYTSKVFINSTFLAVGTNKTGHITFPVANRVPNDKSRLGIEAVSANGKTFTVDRYAVKGHRWVK